MNTYDWFKEHLTSIDDIGAMTSQINNFAMKTVCWIMSHWLKGIVYQDTTTPSYESQISELEHEALAKEIFILQKKLSTFNCTIFIKDTHS